MGGTAGIDCLSCGLNTFFSDANEPFRALSRLGPDPDPCGPWASSDDDEPFENLPSRATGGGSRPKSCEDADCPRPLAPLDVPGRGKEPKKRVLLGGSNDMADSDRCGGGAYTSGSGELLAVPAPNAERPKEGRVRSSSSSKSVLVSQPSNYGEHYAPGITIASVILVGWWKDKWSN